MAAIKKYNGSTFIDAAIRKYSTASEIIVPPTTIYTDGTAITAYTIKGNTVQNGTPTPSNPVDVNGVGERTENLWSENYSGISAGLTYVPIYVGNGQFTLSTSTPFAGQAANVFILAGNVSSGASTANNGAWDGVSRTATAIDGYVTICYRNATANPEDFETMLNTGSTAKPYEPYGYKIPISSGQTVNNYLGSIQSTRQIQKLVLDGNEESWSRSTSYSGGFFSSWTNFGGVNFGAIYCSHAQYVSDITDYVSGTCYSDGSLNIRIMPEGSTVTQWREYLAQQYANGTPVTVWYVLQIATTGVVNEPLMKIGTYADSISNAVAIPTTEGANTIFVDTTVQPSEFTATWTGWHDSSVKEYDGTNWQ